MHREHRGGPGWRWELPGATKTLVKTVDWCLASEDYLYEYFALLGYAPRGLTIERIENRKGGAAELYTWKYADVDETQPKFFHGTTPGALLAILQQGFKNSEDENVHEFTTPGLYVTSIPKDALNPYAVSVKFTTDAYHNPAVPYVRVVLLVQVCGPSLGPCKKLKTNGEYVFDAAHEAAARKAIAKHNTVTKPPWNDMQKHLFDGDTGVTVCVYPHGKLGDGMR